MPYDASKATASAHVREGRRELCRIFCQRARILRSASLFSCTPGGCLLVSLGTLPVSSGSHDTPTAWRFLLAPGRLRMPCVP
jgi:hypothetical protein